ncbi:sugar phosphate isomerase/epimerase family protein [Streptomyces sp. NPDC059467]|uniref:sugar phosphate isomerase/epimerase family protein n=1 Tax=Streptomyces sp. NPDC059467 TaxID=3346844 RepID=UPI00369DB853
MELCLYTDSVPDLTMEEALDLTVSLGGTAVEIAAGGQSRAPHMDVFSLVDDVAERGKFADALSSRGLRMGAVNCSAWPMHPRKGARHVEIMEAAVRLAEQLGVKKIVTMTGNPGESPDAQLTNWIFYP